MNKVIEHVKNHKTVYISAGIGLAHVDGKTFTNLGEAS